MLWILLRLNLAIAVILLSPMLVVIATALRPPSSSLSNTNSVSTTATTTTTVPFSKERWNEYVAQCREVVRQPSNRPRAPPVPHDGGGAYSDQVVCFYQSRVLTLPSSSVAADTATTTTTTTTGTKASDGATYSIPSLQPMTDETLWAHIQRIEASYWNGTWEVERWKRRNRRKTSNTSDGDHSGQKLHQQQENEDARVQGDYRTKGVVENLSNDTNNEDDNDLESYYASTFQQLDRATMVLHEPHVVAVALHVLWSTVNYYHLLMDALLPAAEWQRHSLDQWRLEQQQQRERQTQREETSRQRRELNARRARWRAAGMSGGATEQQTADFHNSNNNHHSNKKPPPMEVIVSGFADSIRTNRKKRLPATMAIAALLSTDQRTAIMAEGSDQRAHCFCHQVQFWANTLPRFGPRRERALRYLNRKMARSALFGRPTTEKDLVRSKDDAPHRRPSTTLPSASAAADDAGPNLLPKQQQQQSGEAVGSRSHRISQAHRTERGRVCQRLARSTSTTSLSSSSGENSESLDRPPRHVRFLYLTRSRRKAHNEDRLLQLAAEEASLQMDVERVNFEHLTIAQQLHWIRWADVVMGVHGMQLTFIAHSIATHDYQTDSVSTSSAEAAASKSSSDFLTQLQEEVEDLGDEEITRVPCRTLIELYPYVHGEFLFTLHEVPKISGWSYERVVPVDVVFGPSVADPVLEKHQLMQKDFPFWNLAAFGDQNTTYAEHEVRRALKRAIQRWQSCCRVDRQ